jgi:hypothetical protein
MMTAAYKLKPEAGDVVACETHARWYVIRKVLRWPRSLTWYDNQLVDNFHLLFRRFKSLRLLSNETLERFQAKLSNQLTKHFNNGANGGQVPDYIKLLGDEATKAYRAFLAVGRGSVARWIFEQLLLHSWRGALGKVHTASLRLANEGRKLDWSAYKRLHLKSQCVLRHLNQLKAQWAVRHRPDHAQRHAAGVACYYAPEHVAASEQLVARMKPIDAFPKVRAARREAYSQGIAGQTSSYARDYVAGAPLSCAVPAEVSVDWLDRRGVIDRKDAVCRQQRLTIGRTAANGLPVWAGLGAPPRGRPDASAAGARVLGKRPSVQAQGSDRRSPGA